MTPTRPELLQIRTSAAAVAGSIGLTLTVAATVARPEVHPAWFSWLVIVTEAGAVGWCVRDAVVRAVPARGPVALVAVSAALLAMSAYATHGHPSPLPPALHVISVGLVLSPTALGTRGAVVTAAYFVVAFIYLRAPASGQPTATIEGLQHLVVICIQLVLWRMLLGSADRTEAGARARWAAEKQAARARERAIQTERWNALIHDKVLGALLLAIRRRPAPAAELAQDALDSMDLRGPGVRRADDLHGAIGDAARRLGLRLAVDVDGSSDGLDPEVLAAVHEATAEVLTNVARHSGQAIAWVEGHVSAQSIHLVIGDPGRGFDPSRPTGRAGLRTSVLARVGSVGGSARIQSAPGRGCRVTVDWAAAPVVADDDGPWSPAIVQVMFALGCTVILLAAWVGLAHPQFARSSAVTAAGVLAVVFFSSMLALGRAHPALVLASGVGLVLMAGALAANVAPPYEADWRWWFVGALDTAAAMMVLRHSLRAGLLFSVGVVVAIGVGHGLAPEWGSDAGLGTGPGVGALAGESLSFLPAVPQVFITVFLAGIVRRGLERAQRNVRQTAERAATAEIAALAADERTATFRQRSAELREEAGPALAVIATRHPPDAGQHDDWRRLEARLRDRLVAGPALTSGSVAAVEAARDRGVDVEVVALGEVGPGDASLFEALLSVVLPHVVGGSRVIAQWRAGGDGRLATVTVLGRWARPETVAVGAHRLAVEGDDDASVVTLT